MYLGWLDYIYDAYNTNTKRLTWTGSDHINSSELIENLSHS